MKLFLICKVLKDFTELWLIESASDTLYRLLNNFY